MGASGKLGKYAVQHALVRGHAVVGVCREQSGPKLDDFKKRMLDLGGEPKAGTPEELDARLKSDIDMWAAVVKKAGLEPH